MFFKLLFSGIAKLFFYILQEPEPIDWDYYRKGIGTRLVDMYKEHYESMFMNSIANAINLYIFRFLNDTSTGYCAWLTLCGDDKSFCKFSFFVMHLLSSTSKHSRVLVNPHETVFTSPFPPLWYVQTTFDHGLKKCSLFYWFTFWFASQCIF